jgi:gamma-glutamyl phosphate reductase
MDIKNYIEELCKSVKAVSGSLAILKTDKKNQALMKIAEKLVENTAEIIAANEIDVANADSNGISKTMVDRLTLNEKRIKDIADSLSEVCMLADPIGSGETLVRPNGLKITRIHVPLGVVAIICESRPNVTVDAAALCIKSGNAVIIRGGKEAINTNRVLMKVMRDALSDCGIDENCIALVDDTTREGTYHLMQMRGYVDVLIPRGGAGLINSVIENAKIPVIETGVGNCHVYIDSFADMEIAVKVAVNAKVSRPSVCNAAETILVHADIANEFLPKFADGVKPWNVELRGCERTKSILPDITSATEEDYDTEYLDYICAVKIVDSIDEAITHINKYNTFHSEAIITKDIANADKFKTEIDAAAVYVNASTRFTDGGVFGLGAEMGISTQKLHVRGPMGLKEMTTVKYIIDGDGQVR